MNLSKKQVSLKPMPNRKKIPINIETAILTKSSRRCPLCYCLHGDLGEKLGQIAHLDQGRSNNNEDNLVFMCWPHHTQYDSQPSQHKNYTPGEVKECRKKLYEAISRNDHHLTKNATPETYAADDPLDEARQLIKDAADDSISVLSLARKAMSVEKKHNDLEMLEWLDKELNGYRIIPAENLLSYRKIYGEAYVLYRHHPDWMRVSFDSEEVKMSWTYAPNYESIASIESGATKQMIIFANASAEQAIREGLQCPESVIEY